MISRARVTESEEEEEPVSSKRKGSGKARSMGNDKDGSMLSAAVRGNLDQVREINPFLKGLSYGNAPPLSLDLHDPASFEAILIGDAVVVDEILGATKII